MVIGHSRVFFCFDSQARTITLHSLSFGSSATQARQASDSHRNTIISDRFKHVLDLRWLEGSPGGGGVLPIMAYTGRLRPKGVPFSGFKYKKG